MSFEDFNDFGFEVTDESEFGDDYIDLSSYQKVQLNQLDDGEEICGKPLTTLFKGDEGKSDSIRLTVLSEDDDGDPIAVHCYCNIPLPETTDKKGNEYCNLFRNNTFTKNTYNAIFSVLNLKGTKGIFGKDKQPKSAIKNINAKGFLETIGKQEEITIRVVELPPNSNGDVYNTFVIDEMK